MSKVKFLGPNREGMKACDCGRLYGDYKVHRETGFHKRWAQEVRRARRKAREAS